MNERFKRAGLVVPVLVGVTVLGLGFGGGVLAGRATAKPRAAENGEGSLSAREAKEKLAACRSELKELTKTRATAAASVVPPPGEANDAGPEKMARAEALQKEVDECRVRETLVKAQVCGTISNHINLLFVLAHSASCEDKAGVGDFLVNSLDKCAEFEAFPAHLDREALTQGEVHRIWESKTNRAARSKDKLAEGVREELRSCREKFGLPDK